MESTDGAEVPVVAENCNLFELLADEIIIHILSDSALGLNGVCRFGKTSKRHLRISHDQKIWKAKLIHLFPYIRHLAALCPVDEDWRAQCIKMHHIPPTALTLLSALPYYDFDSDDVPYMMFIPLGTLCADKFCHVAIDLTLRKILNDDNPNHNLSEKYYAKKGLRYVTHSVLKKEWKDFFELPQEEQRLEDGAILLAMWCQPLDDIRAHDIKKKINGICDTVKAEIASSHGDEHPSCQKYEYDGEHVPSLSLDQSKQVLESINTVLYKKLGFCGNSQDYNNEVNSYINLVLENKLGIPITLSILYEAIARRLGVTLKPVNFPGHFLLVFDMTEFGFSQNCKYIDAFHEGKQLTASECETLTETPVQEGSEYFAPCTTKDVILRMTNNLMQLSPHSNDRQMLTPLELFVEIKPNDIDALIKLARFYVQMRINLHEILEQLSEIRSTNNLLQASLVTFLMQRARAILNKQRSSNRSPEVKRRAENPEVVYSVGLVMRHKKYHYNCVIYGWDPTCDMPGEWKEQMGVQNLSHKDEQPFYNVFVDDGSSRYAAQENLEYHDNPQLISHPEIGKCFEEFNGRYYTLAPSLLKHYPNDTEVTQEKAEELYPEHAS